MGSLGFRVSGPPPGYAKPAESHKGLPAKKGGVQGKSAEEKVVEPQEFRGLGFRGLGFRGLGFRGLGFRGLGFIGSFAFEQ